MVPPRLPGPRQAAHSVVLKSSKKQRRHQVCTLPAHNNAKAATRSGGRFFHNSLTVRALARGAGRNRTLSRARAVAWV
jgi:hypothetical protein